MTKKAKIDIDMLFMGDCFTQAEKAAISQSELFPIVAAIYNTTGGEIKCGPIARNLNLSDKRGSLIMSNSAGVPVFEVQYETDYRRGKLIALNTVNGFANDRTGQISSTRTAYIINQIKKGKMKSVVEDVAYRAAQSFHKLLRGVVSESIGEGFSKTKQKPNMHVPEDDVLEIVKMVATGGTPASLPVATYESIMSIYNRYREKLTASSDAEMKLIEFWSRDKWLMLFDPYCLSEKNNVNEKNHEGGFMLIRINGQRMALQVSLGLENKYADFNYAQAIDSVVWCKNSPDDIEDPAIRTELLSSLMMLKVHTDSSKMYPESQNTIVKVYEDLGAYVRCGGWYDLPVVVVE